MIIQGHCHYWLWPKVILISKLKLAFLRNLRAILTKFCMLALRYKEMDIYQYNVGHMTKMAAIYIYGKNSSKIFSGTSLPIQSTKNGV